MTTRAGSGWGAVCLSSTALVLALTAAVLPGQVLDGEAVLRDAVLAKASPRVMDAARWASAGGTWRLLVPATLLVLSVSGPARHRWWLWGATLAAAPLIGEGWQEVVSRRRPSGSALGFPSGHATSAAAFAVMVIYLVGRARLPPAARLALQALAALGMLAVGLARILLGAHWPADVLAGFALGCACAAAAAWWDAAHPHRRPEGHGPEAARGATVAPPR